MTVSTAVKWAVSSMTGAPTLNGTAGSLIALLDAFLVNGFGTKAVDSATVTDGICRMDITGGSAAQDHVVIQLAGVTGDGVVLNGNQRAKTATSSYVEFACDLPDGPLTGTITFKIAPLGWEKVFSKTNVAVYRSTDLAGTRAYYRVDDTNALYARVQMFESMSGVDSGLKPSPTSDVAGFYWHKRQAAGASGAYWFMCGDSRLVHFLVCPSSVVSPSGVGSYGVRSYWAGDVQSYRSGDAWSAGLGGAPSASFGDLSGCVFTGNSAAGLILMRQSHGVGNASACQRWVMGNVTSTSGADSSLGVFPSRADNGLRLSHILISDGDLAAHGPRGEIPGIYHCMQTGALMAFGNSVSLQDGSGSFAGRKLVSIAAGSVTAAATGCGFIDVTGPWRAQ